MTRENQFPEPVANPSVGLGTCALPIDGDGLSESLHADRRFFKSLNEFRQSEAESAAREEATPSLPTASRWVGHEARMGSSCGMSSSAGQGQAWGSMDAPMAEIPVVRGPEGQPLVFKPAVKQPG